VLEVNYRGSTGYGRQYMLRLRQSWGIYDVEDSIEGARSLATQGRVDDRRRAIMGGSAGGFTVLQALVTHPGFFTAGVCLYGVSNQFTLATDTHKFEQHYLDSLLGPLPQAAAVYRERSPIFHAERITDPIAVGGRTDRATIQGDARVIEEDPHGGWERLLPIWEKKEPSIVYFLTQRVALPLFFERSLIEITPRRALYWADGNAATAPEMTIVGKEAA